MADNIFLIFDKPTRSENQAWCDDWLDAANTYYGYGSGQGTETYSQPLLHPDGIKVGLPAFSNLFSDLEGVRLSRPGWIPYTRQVRDEWVPPPNFD